MDDRLFIEPVGSNNIKRKERLSFILAIKTLPARPTLYIPTSQEDKFVKIEDESPLLPD